MEADWKSNNLLAKLPLADLKTLLPHFFEVPLIIEAMLHDVGDIVEHVYFPISGMISLVVVLDNGDAIETQTVGKEGVVGVGLTIGAQPTANRAIVQSSGCAIRVPEPTLRREIGRSEGLRDIIALYNHATVAQLGQLAACNLAHHVSARLARWLLQTQDRVKLDTLPLTQEFLSQMLGVRRPTLNTAAQSLQSAGSIRYARGRVTILDRKSLEQVACECYGHMRRFESEKEASHPNRVS